MHWDTSVTTKGNGRTFDMEIEALKKELEKRLAHFLHKPVDEIYGICAFISLWIAMLGFVVALAFWGQSSTYTLFGILILTLGLVGAVALGFVSLRLRGNNVSPHLESRRKASNEW